MSLPFFCKRTASKKKSLPDFKIVAQHKIQIFLILCHIGIKHESHALWRLSQHALGSLPEYLFMTWSIIV